ncbi:MAG TPA: polysaccharide deacetylase family protein [Casimicrobiaceae bacterium]|jgi:allantoinase|nr:polysaccharide deacetylase family protein [Casimicrobiaceae bacterium]
MTAPSTPRQRVPYSAIVDRPQLALPDGARMIVWTIVNVEDWGIERPMPRTVLSPPMGQPLLPDLPNWAWHEYGMRVGFWRLLGCLQKFGVTPTLAINGVVCRNYPRLAQAAKDAGWEFMGHGWRQEPMHKVEDQRAAIRDTIEAIRACTGNAPRGWESPGLAETFETIDHLAEAGIEYVADWVLDDQPVYIATAHGPVVSVPYTVEVNDIAMMVVQHHSADEMLRRGGDHFDRLYEESARSHRVMAISVHPYISGVPHRIGYLEQLYRHVLGKPGVVHWTGAQILDWFRSQVAPEPPRAS